MCGVSVGLLSPGKIKRREVSWTLMMSWTVICGSRRDQEEGGGAGPSREPRRDQKYVRIHASMRARARARTHPPTHICNLATPRFPLFLLVSLHPHHPVSTSQPIKTSVATTTTKCYSIQWCHHSHHCHKATTTSHERFRKQTFPRTCALFCQTRSCITRGLAQNTKIAFRVIVKSTLWGAFRKWSIESFRSAKPTTMRPLSGWIVQLTVVMDVYSCWWNRKRATPQNPINYIDYILQSPFSLIRCPTVVLLYGQCHGSRVAAANACRGKMHVYGSKHRFTAVGVHFAMKTFSLASY